MIQGIHITATFEPPMPFSDEWLEAVYTSVQRNMAVVSADMFTNEDASSITFHLGIDAQMGFSEDFVVDVSRDAIDKAFEDASAGSGAEEPPIVVSGKVMAFA